MTSTLGIILFLAMTPAQDRSAIEATLAWGGAISSDAFTEVSLQAEPGQSYSVATASGSPIIRTALEAPDNGGASAAMPVDPQNVDVVNLDVQPANAVGFQLRAGELKRSRSPIVLVGVSAASIETVPESLVVPVSDLPRLASAYANIHALVIDGSALAQLGEQQFRAVLEHIGNCGRTMLVDATANAARMLAQRAGCGGEALFASSSGAQLDAELASLLEQRINSMPGTNLLRTLAGSHSSDLQLMTLFLAGFTGVFVMLSMIPRTRIFALGFCLLSTGLAAALWSTAPHESLVAWSEVSNGDRIARYAAIERLTSGSRGEHTVQPESLTRSPREISGQRLTLHWSASASERRLEWNASLLEEAQLLTVGSFPVEPNLRAGADGNAIRVCNHGAATSPPSWLRWQGKTYAVPALAPSTTWTPVDAAPVTDRRPELRLLARRMQRHSLALLQPLRVPANGGKQDAWLMRVESDVPESSPCSG